MPTHETTSKTYKGSRKAAKGKRKMVAAGWQPLTETTHRQYWSWATGFMLLRRRRHVVTYERYVPTAEEGAEMECVPGCVLEPHHAGLCQFEKARA